MWLGSIVAAAALGLIATAAQAQSNGAAPPAPACERGDVAPPAPPKRLAPFVGQYGSADNILDVSEACGVLFADGRGLRLTPLKPAAASQFTAIGPDGAIVTLTFAQKGSSVTLGRERLERHDFGAEGEAKVRAGVAGDPDRLRRQALAAQPPSEPPHKRTSDLVSVPGLDPAIRIHTLYAGTDNFLGIPIYERSGAYMQRPAAEALARVEKALRAKGYGLLITDAYRPWFATRMFWDATPPEDHIFVADPAHGSRHNRGCAVDLTLFDLKTGKPVEMTGRVDEMSKRSYPDYRGGTSLQRWRRDLLRRAMTAEGFTVYGFEWWHFDYKDWADYPIGTATYTELDEGKAH